MAYKLIPFTCQVCQKESLGVPAAKFCGAECFVRSRKKTIPYTCQTCGKECETTPGHIKQGQGKYCSRDCKYAAQRTPLEEQFWAIWATMEKPEDPTCCWLWPGSRETRGYGRLKVEGKAHKAYRLALIFHGITLAEGEYGCHTCNNKPCVRVHPLHVYRGTPQQNIDDRQKSGHTARGEHHWKAKLTEQDVIEIRATWNAAQKKFGLLSILGEKYGVCHSMIRRIVTGQNWTHTTLPPPPENADRKAIQEAIELRQGEHNCATKLTDVQVQELRRKHQQGSSAVMLAQEYGITITHTYAIIKGQHR